MQKKKYWVMAATAALVTLSSPAVAAELSNGNGQDCGDAVGSWHFVNNQTGGAAAGTLNATFSDGTVWNVAPSAVSRRSAASTLSAMTEENPSRSSA